MGALGRPKGLRVRTACTTEEEFIALFHSGCTESSVFAPTEKVLPEGADCAFSIELADGQPMLRGLGVVMNAWPTAENRFARVGVHIGFVQLTTTSETVLEKLLAARAIAEVATRRRSITQLRFGLVPPDELTAASPEDESVVNDVRSSITQELHAVDLIEDVAAPLAVDEKTDHTTRYEGLLRTPAPLSRPPIHPPGPAAANLGGLAAAPVATRAHKTLPPPMLTTPPALTAPLAATIARGSLPSIAVTPPSATAPPATGARGRMLASFGPAYLRVARATAPLGSQLSQVADRIDAWLAPATNRLVGSGAVPQWRTGHVIAIFATGIVVGALFLGSGASDAPKPVSQVAAITPKCSAEQLAYDGASWWGPSPAPLAAITLRPDDPSPSATAVPLEPAAVKTSAASTATRPATKSSITRHVTKPTAIATTKPGSSSTAIAATKPTAKAATTIATTKPGSSSTAIAATKPTAKATTITTTKPGSSSTANAATKPSTTIAATKPTAKAATTIATTKPGSSSTAIAATKPSTKTAAPKPSTTIATTKPGSSPTAIAATKPLKTTAATKPSTTSAATKPTSKPSTTIAATKSSTAIGAAKPTAKAATAIAVTKPGAKPSTTSAPTKPAAATSTKPTATKASPAAAKQRPGKRGCQSLDCI